MPESSETKGTFARLAGLGAFAHLTGLGNISLRLGQNRTIRGVTEGLINLVPLVLIGTICLALTNLPIPAIHVFLNSITGNHWTLISDMIVFSTEHIIGLAALLSVSYVLAGQSNSIQKREISSFIPMFTAFSCYVVLLVWDPVSYALVPEGQPPEVLFTNAGQRGVFFALFVAVVATKLFALFTRLWQKLPWFRRRIVGSYILLRNALHTAAPILLTLTCFIVLRMLLDWLFSTTEVQAYLGNLIASLVNDGRLPFVVITILIMQILWFFGAHGSYTIQTLMPHVDTAATGNTVQALAAGAPGPTTVFTNWDFYNIFIEMGGAGTTMALLIALLLFGSKGRGKRLGRISIFPVTFNINETLLFGIPIVFNPLMLIPFILAPVTVACVSFGAISLGVVPPIINSVEWTTPILFSGYLATDSFAGPLLQALCIGLAFLIYAPFVLAVRIATDRHQLELFERFKKEAQNAANNETVSVSGRHDDIGTMANQFITEISMSFSSNNIPLCLMYQPKTDNQGRAAGAEALLRWMHPMFGPIPPDILVELADEADFSAPLGRWIATEALEEFARWQQSGLEQLVLSINLNPRHVFIDEEFPEFLQKEMERLGVEPGLIDLEITEHMAVGASKEMLLLFQQLRNLGVRLSIDDMGMGYSSLTYISDFGASVIKIDISLIDQVATDVKQQEIVRSIIDLARQINLTVIVEGVETQEQVNVLAGLGCNYFQGFFFSKPLSPQDFLAYVDAHGTTLLLHEGTQSS
ncbi:MAG: EAL domain-containing protein [Coriobacteriia bacterium]|nr:EAL domain-containing protein [Coriobacteriia bacterium]MCL2749947.1 EAL domain-containing protein [Coriobacteriia bacterium]